MSIPTVPISLLSKWCRCKSNASSWLAHRVRMSIGCNECWIENPAGFARAWNSHPMDASRCVGIERSKGLDLLLLGCRRSIRETANRNTIVTQGHIRMDEACKHRGPRKRPRHHSYDESVDQPAGTLEQEAVEIDHEVPAEDAKGPRPRRGADGDCTGRTGLTAYRSPHLRESFDRSGGQANNSPGQCCFDMISTVDG